MLGSAGGLSPCGGGGGVPHVPQADYVEKQGASHVISPLSLRSILHKRHRGVLMSECDPALISVQLRRG